MRTRPGCSGSLPATGWSSRGPKRSASATCSARVMSWSRTKSTLYCSSSALSSANSRWSREASARLTWRSSAPMVAVSGTTSMLRLPTVKDGKRSSTAVSKTVVTGFSLGGWGRSGSGGLEDEDRGADAAAGLQVAVGLDGVVQGVALVDRDLDAAGGEMAEQLSGEQAALGRVRDVVGQGRPGHEQRALDGQLHRVDRRDRARRRPPADPQAAAGGRGERPGARGPAGGGVGGPGARAPRGAAGPGRGGPPGGEGAWGG